MPTPATPLTPSALNGLHVLVGELVKRLDHEAAVLDAQRRRLDAARMQMGKILDHLDARIHHAAAPQRAARTTKTTRSPR